MPSAVFFCVFQARTASSGAAHDSLAPLFARAATCARLSVVPLSRSAPASSLGVPVLLRRRRGALAEEKSRRTGAERLVYCSKGGGGIRPSEFPSVRDVTQSIEQFPTHAINWSDQARAIGGSHRALPATMQSVLVHTFLVCKEEVERCLGGRLGSVSNFLDEPVELSELSGGDPTNLDPHYVLYECLCRTYRTIVPTDQVRMDELAGIVQQRCAEGGRTDAGLARDIIFGEEAWPYFDNLMKNYILVFVEVRREESENLPRVLGVRSFERFHPWSKRRVYLGCGVFDLQMVADTPTIPRSRRVVDDFLSR